MSLNRGDVLLEQGAAVRQLIFPSSAVLSGVAVFADGRSVEAMTIGLEGVAGAMGALIGAPAFLRTFAQVGGSAYAVPIARARALAAESQSFRDLLIRSVEAAAGQAEQGAACNALHEAPMRLAKWLLLTQDRTGRDEFELTQEYMAVMVGVQRTTINAVALALKREGLIRYSRGSVRVLNRAAVEARACECYKAIRERETIVFGANHPDAMSQAV